MPSQTLQDLRNQIDAIDADIRKLINKRMTTARQMQGMKTTITDRERETSLRNIWRENAKETGFSSTCANTILDALLLESKRQQGMESATSHTEIVFDHWNARKKEVQRRERLDFRERDIWFARLGKNIGSEQDGKGEYFLRPVIIVRKYNRDIFLSLPLTRTLKKGPYYYHFSFNDRDSAVVLSQLRLLDAKRLSHKIGKMHINEFEALKKAISLFLS